MTEGLLEGATIDPAIGELRPDYRALLLAVQGIEPGPSDEGSEALLVRAEAAAQEVTASLPIEEIPEIAAWRDAYRAFGAKPQRTRNSLEALTRRAEVGLPRVNRLTDIYNAISVIHRIPLGGEDLQKYVGPPRLLRALGQEPFDTVSEGEIVIEHPEKGEVVWCDDAGVTCRRWNWRQARRTQLSDATTSALFILDALTPVSDAGLQAAADELAEHLLRLGSSVTIAQRLIRAV